MTTVIVPFRNASERKKAATLSTDTIAKKTQLRFFAEDEVGASVIALDRHKRKLIYAKKAPAVSSCLQVDLRHIDGCSIVKHYGPIEAGALQTNKLQNFLQSIFMHLSFKHRPGKLSLPLYDAKRDDAENVEHLEQKARKWQAIISQVLPVTIRERA